MGDSERATECSITEDEMPALDWVIDHTQQDSMALFQTDLHRHPSFEVTSHEYNAFGCSSPPSDRLDDPYQPDVSDGPSHLHQTDVPRLPPLAFAPSALEQLIAIWDPGHGRTSGPQDPQALIFASLCCKLVL